jgi:hypothetical protein
MTTHANTVLAQITQLPHLPIANLWALWDEFFDRRPGHHHRTYLESRIAYKLQERAFSGLPAALRRKLEKIGETGEVPNHKRKSEHQLVPGTVMVREIQRVDVSGDRVGRWPVRTRGPPIQEFVSGCPSDYRHPLFRPGLFWLETLQS